MEAWRSIKGNIGNIVNETVQHTENAVNVMERSVL